MSIRVRGLLLGAWPLALSVVLVLPVFLHTGYPLARDMMFVPHQPWTDATIGLGGVAPRAVPLDSAMALLTDVVDGAVVARLVLVLVLASAGWGVARLLRSHGVAAALVGSGFAVWNPYVVERLALGQWALLTAYAAVPWLLILCERQRISRARADLAPVVLWSAIGSLTPTGGLIVLATLFVAVGRHWRRTWPALLSGLVLQAPWVVAGVVGGVSGTSDPHGVAAFAPDTEGPGGAITAMLGLGGIWDSLSEPATRTTWLNVTSAVVVLVIVVGAALVTRQRSEPHLTALAVLGLAGLGLAVFTALGVGQDALEWAVAELPGAGLLRDGQKFVAPFALLAAACAGLLAGHLQRRFAGAGTEISGSVVVAFLLLPFLLLPDGTTRTWPTVHPHAYPQGFVQVGDALDRAAREGDDSALVTLPWRSYRAFGWGGAGTSADPAIRWFDRTVVVSDNLQVGDDLIEGESGLARDVGRLLATDTSLTRLGDLGVGWVLVYEDDPDRDRVDITGLVEEYSDGDLSLYRVPEAQRLGSVSTFRRMLVLAAQISYGSLVLLALLALVVCRVRRSASGDDTVQ